MPNAIAECRGAALGALGVLLLLASASSAWCGGGFSGSGGGAAFGEAASDAWTVIVSEQLEHQSHTFANVNTTALANGSLLDVDANAGNFVESIVIGNATYDQKNKAKAKVYAKGGSIIGKARSQTFTTICIDGVTYVVAEELARALARFTPLGTTAAAASDTSVSAEGNGYIGVNTGTKNEASVRIQN